MCLFLKKVSDKYKKKWEKVNICLIGYDGSDYFDIISWTILTVCFHHPNPVQNSDALTHSSKNTVLSVQPLGGCKCEEELTAVGVGPSIGHGKNSTSLQTQTHKINLDLFIYFSSVSLFMNNHCDYLWTLALGAVHLQTVCRKWRHHLDLCGKERS